MALTPLENIMSEAYEQLVDDAAEIRVELDEALHPRMSNLKTAFTVAWKSEGFRRGDFKLISDMVYYQGGYPNEDTPARETILADLVAKVVKLSHALDRDNFVKLLDDRGVHLELAREPDKIYQVEGKEADQLKNSWHGAGMSGEPPADRYEMLKLMIAESQTLQKTICGKADEIKVEAAETAQEEHGIKRSNFVKAVGIAAIQKRRGHEAAAERVTLIEEQQDNLTLALEPFAAKVETV
jgi:hypothetical protein